MVIEDQNMANENWHLSKTIPIAFLFGIAAQTVVLVWYIAGVVNMVENNARDIERQEIQVKELTDRVNDHAVMMGRIDENLKFLREYIEQK
jgi:uncharacterized membrane protein YciS (DUF1049 family)